MGWALVGLFIATLLTFVLSIRLSLSNPTTGSKICCAILCFIIMMTINFAVSFAGCAVGSQFLPGLNFH